MDKKMKVVQLTTKPITGRLLAVLFAVSIIAQSVAAQTPSWSSATNLSAAGQSAYDPQIAVTPDGTKAAAIWAEYTSGSLIIQTAFATISAGTATWGSVVDLTLVPETVTVPQIAISSDGTKATAIWSRQDGSFPIIRTASATLSGTTPTWSSVTDLSQTGQSSYFPQVALSSDGTGAIAVWLHFDGVTFGIQSSAATISGNSATWSAVTNFSTVGQNAESPQIALTPDGTKATAVWKRSTGIYTVIQAVSATLSGNTATWGSVIDLSTVGVDCSEPQIALSTDGALATVVWLRTSGDDIVQSVSGSISGTSATWGSVSDLSAIGRDAYEPKVSLASDGTKAVATWRRNETSGSVAQVSAATVSGTSAIWGSATTLSDTGQEVRRPDFHLASDGTKGAAIWSRFNGTSHVIQSVSALISGTTFSPGSVVNISVVGGVGNDAVNPELALAGDGTKASAVWVRNDGSNDIVQSASATISYPTETPPTPTPPTPTDTTAPSVRALKSKGKVGRRMRLRYELSDDSGQSQETITITRRARLLKTVTVSLRATPARGIRKVKVKLPFRQAEKVRFCVTATDASNNSSAQSCARGIIK